MGDQEIQKILDDLDIQLSAGKIDLATYQTLSQKWTARLTGAIERARAPAPPVSPAMVTVKVACPNCGAPLGEAFSPAQVSYRCEYCSQSFALRDAQKETEKLKEELQGWLRQLVAGTTPGGTVDATSRAFIFREKLYPSLQVEFSRALEWLDGSRELPLFEIELGTYFPSYALTASPLIARRDQPTSIRNLVGKLTAPVVREFAVSPDDGQKLALMEIRTRELIYAANLLEQSRKFNADGYSAALQNISAMKQVNCQAQSLVGTGAGTVAEKQFLRACFTRLQGAEVVLDVLSRLYQSPGGEIMGSTFCGQLEAALRSYREALALAEESHYSSVETVPWQYGVERELNLVALELTLLHCYDRAVANRRGSFLNFQSGVKNFVAMSQAGVSDPQGLAQLVESLTRVVEAKRGSKGLARIADWSWLRPAIELNRKKSSVGFLGINEQVETTEQYWHPFWIADLTYSHSEGSVFKSGTAKHGLLLLDATSTRQVFASVVFGGSALYTQIESCRESTDGTLALPVLVAETAAQKVLDGYARSNPNFRNTQVKTRGVVYLPASRVVYQSKQGVRPVTVSAASVFNRETGSLSSATLNFATQYVG